MSRAVGIGEQPHPWPQLFQVGGQVHGQQMREAAAVQIHGPSGVRQQRHRGFERRVRQRGQRFGGPLVLRPRLLQQPVEQTARGRRIRQPGDRAVRLGRQLGAQRDLQIGEPVVAERLREPQHGRRADLGAFGQPGRAGQPGARIVGEKRAADPALGLAQRRQRGPGPCRDRLRRSWCRGRHQRQRRHRQVVHRDRASRSPSPTVASRGRRTPSTRSPPGPRRCGPSAYRSSPPGARRADPPR